VEEGVGGWRDNRSERKVGNWGNDKQNKTKKKLKTKKKNKKAQQGEHF